MGAPTFLTTPPLSVVGPHQLSQTPMLGLQSLLALHCLGARYQHSTLCETSQLLVLGKQAQAPIVVRKEEEREREGKKKKRIEGSR